MKHYFGRMQRVDVKVLGDLPLPTVWTWAEDGLVDVHVEPSGILVVDLDPGGHVSQYAYAFGTWLTYYVDDPSKVTQ